MHHMILTVIGTILEKTSENLAFLRWIFDDIGSCSVTIETGLVIVPTIMNASKKLKCATFSILYTFSGQKFYFQIKGSSLPHF